MISRIPIISIACFLVCYIISVWYYPGGNQIDVTTSGFDWLNNYWCDLMREYSHNGMLNSGRYFAIMGMLFLCVAVGFLFYLFPKYYPLGESWNMLIKYVGPLAMSLAFFIFTPWHDPFLITSCVLAIFPLTGIFVGLKKGENNKLFFFGLLCIVLMGINNVIYYANIGVEYLPLIQKITFLIVLIWFALINFSFFRLKHIK